MEDVTQGLPSSGRRRQSLDEGVQSSRLSVAPMQRLRQPMETCRRRVGRSRTNPVFGRERADVALTNPRQNFLVAFRWIAGLASLIGSISNETAVGTTQQDFDITTAGPTGANGGGFGTSASPQWPGTTFDEYDQEEAPRATVDALPTPTLSDAEQEEGRPDSWEQLDATS